MSVVLPGHAIYQFILRVFKDEKQVFDSFDLCSSCVGYSSSKGYLATEAAAFNIGLGTIFVDPRRFNNTASELRVIKYHQKKGFNLLFDSCCGFPVENHERRLNKLRFHHYKDQVTCSENITNFFGGFNKDYIGMNVDPFFFVCVWLFFFGFHLLFQGIMENVCC